MDTDREKYWIHCPICRNKTRTRVYEDTVLIKFPLYCPKCKREIKITVINLKMVICDETDV
ncbi:MAG: cysteine-rich KTR domain-containing protein [Eubacteriales bacterium]|nr:cysteine-rich KTR domain-containing protein [Eubacteriales bacterium]